MSLIEDQADYLDDLAASIRSVASRLDALERSSLEARLGVDSKPSSGGALIPDLPFAGSDIGRTLGNVLPLNQQTNLLREGSFENLVVGGLNTIEAALGKYLDTLGALQDAWFGSRVGGPTVSLTDTRFRTNQTVTPFHSTALGLNFFFSGGSGLVSGLIRSASCAIDLRSTWGELPYLVAAIKIANLNVGFNDFTAVTSRTAVLELYDVTAAAVVATTSYDLSLFPDVAQGTLYQLSCFATPVTGHSYQLRFRIDVVISGPGANFTYHFGEPQIQFSATPDPGPYTPAVSGWVPDRVVKVGTQGGPYALVAAQSANDTKPRLTINYQGIVEWGSGTAVADARLSRAAAGRLVVDANNASADTLVLVESTGGFLSQIGARVVGDTVARALLEGDATLTGLEFGPGNAARDWQLARNAANSARIGNGHILNLDQGKLSLPVGTAALTATEGFAQWNNSRRFLALYDSVREKPLSEIGWLPFAFHGSASGIEPVTTNVVLPAVGGSVAIPIYLPAPMLLQSVSVKNNDAATARSWEFRLYEDRRNNNNTLDEVAGANGSESFTPGAASVRTVNVAGAPVILPPGIYWLVVRNTHATSTWTIGATAGTAPWQTNSAQTKTLGSALGSTLDLVAATWTKVTGVYGARLNGRVFGQATAF